jgi:hypothetical protein
MAYALIYPWMKNPRLLGIQYTDSVTPLEITDSLEEAAQLMDRSLAQMHIVFDCALVKALPEDLLKTVSASRIIRHGNCGNWVVVGDNEFFCFAMRVVSQQAGLRVDFVDDNNQAWKLFDGLGIC